MFHLPSVLRDLVSNNSTNYFTSAFAAKKTVFKALTLGWEHEVNFREIEISWGQ